MSIITGILAVAGFFAIFCGILVVCLLFTDTENRGPFE